MVSFNCQLGSTQEPARDDVGRPSLTGRLRFPQKRSWTVQDGESEHSELFIGVFLGCGCNATSYLELLLDFPTMMDCPTIEPPE